jgi:hypothetical protein
MDTQFFTVEFDTNPFIYNFSNNSSTYQYFPDFFLISIFGGAVKQFKWEEFQAENENKS